MNKFVCLVGVSLVSGCMVANALTAHTGHLIVSLTDRETGEPITNATVTVRCQTEFNPGRTLDSYFTRTTSKADSNGVANVEFQFYRSYFNWWIRSPTHYCHRYRVGARNEFFKRVVEKSDYLNIDTNTVQGLAMYNELVQLDNNNDYLGFIAKFEPKSETYTKEEVSQLLSAITTGFWQPVSSLPEASADTFGLKIYLVPSPEPKVQNQKDEFITTRTGSEGNYTYAWEQIGSTAIDLSGFVTTEALNAALANYVTSSAFQTALAGKQDTIADLAEIRSGASAGATAYKKPSAGIPASDLADPESVFIIPVNLDTETVDPSITYQDIVDAYNAGKVLAFKTTSSPPYLMYATTVLSITGAIVLMTIKGGISGNSVTSTILALSASPSGIDFQVQEDQIEVPEISTDIDTDAMSDDMTASPKAVKTFVEGKGYGTYSKPRGGIPSSDLAPDVVPVIPVDTAIPSGGLGANVHYALGTLTGSVSITLDTTTEVSGQMNIYSLVFTAGATAPTITWSSAITMWAGNCLDSNGAPVITAGNSYEVSIVNGLAVITEFVA